MNLPTPVSSRELLSAVKIVERFEALPVILSGPGDTEVARAVMHEAGQVYDLIEAKRKELKAPFIAAGKDIDERAKQVTVPMQECIESCREMLRQQKLRQDREEARAMLAATADGRSTPDLSNAVAVAPLPKQAQIPTRVTYEAVVVNPELVPDKYKVIDQRLIDADALGETPIVIPGVEIRKIVTVVNRR